MRERERERQTDRQDRQTDRPLPLIMNMKEEVTILPVSTQNSSGGNTLSPATTGSPYLTPLP